MKNPKTIAIVVVLLLVVAAVGGRITARKAASDYGRTLKRALLVVAASGFADTATLRDFFASPEMATPRSRVETLSFLGGGYRARAEELQRGMLYLSEQMALPSAQRFSAPPAFGFLSLASSDRTDAGVAASAMSLIASYESQL